MKMVRSKLAVWWAALSMAAASTVLASAQEAAGGRHRVLIVYENESTQAAAVEIAQGLHRRLIGGKPTGFEIYSEYLDNARFAGADNLDRKEKELSAKYGSVKVDVAIAIGPIALQFMLDSRDGIAPGAPLLFGAVGQDALQERQLPPDVKGVVSHYDVKRAMQLARRLQPDARAVVVIHGSGPFDRRWEARAREDLGSRFLNFDIRYLTGLSLEGFVEAVEALPQGTAVLILSIFEDAAGARFVPRDSAAVIAAASAAPAYSVYDTFLGGGIVGGYMGTFADVGEQLAALVVRTIEGDRTLPQATMTTARPIVDWRAVGRFGIDPGRLPEGTEIRFREPSIWEDHRPEIVAVAAVIALQGATIAALIVQYRRRRRITDELALERLELAHLSRVQQLGELSGAFAHELNQPLTSILANAEAGERRLQSDPLDTTELGEILADIVADDKRAATIIAQLRSLMVKGEAKLEALDLNQTIGATLALANSELVARQTRVSFHARQSELTVRGSVAQLQQLILNLLLNAAEAMSSLPTTDRRVEIRTEKRKDGWCEMSVTDSGPGIPSELKPSVFKPFVSTKDKGLGLGLAICRSIALAHGGTLSFDDGRSTGARVVLALPSV